MWCLGRVRGLLFSSALMTAETAVSVRQRHVENAALRGNGDTGSGGVGGGSHHRVQQSGGGGGHHCKRLVQVDSVIRCISGSSAEHAARSVPQALLRPRFLNFRKLCGAIRQQSVEALLDLFFLPSGFGNSHLGGVAFSLELGRQRLACGVARIRVCTSNGPSH